jgi:8-oxo-dGTP pyrophosphatase MutT (NUDIX family)
MRVGEKPLPGPWACLRATFRIPPPPPKLLIPVTLKYYDKSKYTSRGIMENQNIELHRVVATAIIHKDGKYLILQRSPNKRVFPGRWTVPGGGLDVRDYIDTPKTTPDAWYFAVTESLKREIEEETGLGVGDLKYLLDLAFIRPDKVPVVTLSYYCDWKFGEVKLNDESVDYKWVKLEEVKNYNLIEGLAEEIEMVDKIKKGENPKEAEFKNI